MTTDRAVVHRVRKTARSRPAVPARPIGLRLSAVSAGIVFLILFAPTALSADPTPVSRWSWTPLGYGIGARGLQALDVDGDGRAELFAAPENQSYWYELRRDGLFRQTWTSFLEESTLVALDAVGTPSGARIAALYQSSLRIYDGGSKAELLRLVTATASNAAVALGDLDHNGVLDAVVCDSDTLYRFELATGTQTGVRHGFGCTDVAIGQIDGDSQLEIAIAGNPTGGYVLDGVSLAVEWGDLEGFGARLALGDLDGDGRDEILASSDLNTDARALDPGSNSELWRIQGYYYPPQLLVADLDPSPGAEAIVKHYYGDISVLVGATGAPIRSYPVDSNSVSRFAAADTDGDGDLELLWGGDSCCYNDGLWLLEGGSNVVVKAADETNILAGGFAVGEFGDGIVKEVAVATPSYSYQDPDQIVILDMAQGREVRRSAFDETTSVGSIAAMTGTQLDADAALELCSGSNAGNGPVACLDGLTFAEEWSGDTYSSVLALQTAEIDGDPAPELLASTLGPAIEAREGDSGWLKWRTAALDTNFDRMSQLLVLDADGDGLDEVLGRMTYYYYPEGEIALYSGATGDLLGGPWDLQAQAMARPALVEDPPIRVYVALADRTIRGLDPQTGVITPPLVNLPEAARALAVVDLDLDGTLDFVIVNSAMHLQVVNGATGVISWTGPYLGPIGYGDAAPTLEAGDLDGNGIPDFAAAWNFGIFFFESPLTVLFGDGFETGDTSAWSATEP